jgi:hypothetical protein
MNRGNNGGISNSAEASFVVRLLKTFAHRYGNVRNISIGVISFYSEQVARIKDRVQDQDLLRWMKSNKISLQISTVDGFQGSEKDIIILSCVRSRWMGRLFQSSDINSTHFHLISWIFTVENRSEREKRYWFPERLPSR